MAVDSAQGERGEGKDGLAAASGQPIWGERLAVCALLGLYLGLAAASAEHDSPTFDEAIHLTAGYSYWVTGDYRLHAENGALIQRLLSAPLLLWRPALPALEQRAWQGDARQGPAVFSFARQFVYADPQEANGRIRVGRAVNLVLAGLLGCLVYAQARTMYGRAGGVGALALYATCPTLLAHGRLVTSDLGAALALYVGVLAVDRLAEALSPARVVWAGLALAAALLCKLSGLLLLPAGAILAGLRLWRDPVTELHVGGRRISLRGVPVRLVAYGVAALAVGVVAWAAIWVAYGGRYAASPGYATGSAYRWDLVTDGPGVAPRAIEWARQRQVLPEAFLWAGAYLRERLKANPAYLLGRWSWYGFPEYFPYCAWAKSSPALWVALILALFARRARCTAWPAAVLIALVAVAALGSRVNIGHRYLLPAYPPLLALAGGAMVAARGWGRWGVVALTGLVALQVHAALGWYPHYLAYASPLAGGARGVEDRLVDSSLDWGQDLPELARWLADHRQPGEPVYLSYFGTADPAAHGVDAIALPPVLMPEWRRPDAGPLAPGLYCLSATHRVNLYPRIGCHGPWCVPYEHVYQEHRERLERLGRGSEPLREVLDRLSASGDAHWRDTVEAFEELRQARLSAYLRQRAPDGRAGLTILVYRLDAAALKAALDGPPVELHESVQVRGATGWTRRPR